MPNVRLSDTTLLYGEPTDVNGLGGLNMNNKVLPNMGTAVLPTDSINKGDVDTAIAALPIFNPIIALQSTSALTTQAPTAIDTPQIIQFGSEVAAGDVTLTKADPGDTEASVITFTTEGIFSFQASFLISRDNNGGEACIVIQGEIGGTPLFEGPTTVMIDNESDIHTRQITRPQVVISSPPTTLKFYLSRYSDPDNENDGGLILDTISSDIPSFTDRPTASILIYRLI